MTFYEFIGKFPTESAAVDYFVNIRYNGVISCPHCGATVKIYRRRQSPRYCNCKSCDNTFSVFTGTIFEYTKVDIRKWFYAINIFLNDKKGVSACNLRREIGGTYRTSWRMLQQIRVAMGNDDTAKAFSTTVEVDETYVGGKPRKTGRNAIRVPAHPLGSPPSALLSLLSPCLPLLRLSVLLRLSTLRDLGLNALPVIPPPLPLLLCLCLRLCPYPPLHFRRLLAPRFPLRNRPYLPRRFL